MFTDVCVNHTNTLSHVFFLLVKVIKALRRNSNPMSCYLEKHFSESFYYNSNFFIISINTNLNLISSLRK